MVRENGKYPTEERLRVRDGEGAVRFEHLLEPAEIGERGRLFGRITIPPGGSIGLHTHRGEMEVFYIVSGEAVVTDQGKETVLLPGDTMLTRPGESHSIRNGQAEDLVYLAVILYE